MTMRKKYYNLLVICDGSMPNFTVDEDSLKSFEKSFDDGEKSVMFIDKEDDGEVKLRNNKLVGYKKTALNHVPADLFEDESKDA